MTDNAKNANSEVELNQELNDLLDSALEDFDKLSLLTDKQDTAAATSDSQHKQTDLTSDKLENDEKDWTEEFVKQTIDQMDKNLQNVLHGDDELNELKSVFQKLEQISADGNSADGEENINMDFESAISQVVKSLSAAPMENLQSDADFLSAMMGQTSLNDGGDELSFVQGMMQQLLSKEILYPSLKELSDKYPAWLEEHKATLNDSNLQRYKKQLELLNKVCAELESEKDDDPKDVKQKRFETVMSLMQEMEKFGRLPNELASTAIPEPKGNFLDEINSVFSGNF